MVVGGGDVENRIGYCGCVGIGDGCVGVCFVLGW